jgi:hypothetical protein
MTVAKYEVLGIRHTYVVYNNTGSFGYLRVYMTNNCEIKVGTTTLEFSGDGTKNKKDYGYECEGSVEADVDDDTLDSILWGLTKVTPAGGDQFAYRYVHGGDKELATNFVEVWCTLDAVDADTGAAAVIRYRVLKAQFDPETPPKFGSQKVAGRMLGFKARRTLTDILGNTPTGMPARGAYWMKDIITNSNYFDPVAGDIL